MKYYIATSLLRAQEHKQVRASLEEFGYVLSYDWTLHGSVKTVSKERLREVSINELNGIRAADYVIVLLPGGFGTHVELGFAIAAGKKVFLYSEDPELFELGPQTNAFYHHPDVTRLCCPLADAASLIDSSLFVRS